MPHGYENLIEETQEQIEDDERKALIEAWIQDNVADLRSSTSHMFMTLRIPDDSPAKQEITEWHKVRRERVTLLLGKCLETILRTELL